MPQSNQPKSLMDLWNQNAPYNPQTIGAMFGYGDASPGTVGFVNRRTPSIVQINRRESMDHPLQRQAPAHELEHVLQNRVGERYGSSYDQQVLRMAKQIGVSPQELIESLKRAGNSSKLKDYINSKFGNGTASAYIGNLPQGSFDLTEQWAGLSGIEQGYNQKLSNRPMVLEEMFNGNPKLRALYNASTGLRTDRLDARDLPPMTIQPNDYK